MTGRSAVVPTQPYLPGDDRAIRLAGGSTPPIYQHLQAGGHIRLEPAALRRRLARTHHTRVSCLSAAYKYPIWANYLPVVLLKPVIPSSFTIHRPLRTTTTATFVVGLEVFSFTPTIALSTDNPI